MRTSGMEPQQQHTEGKSGTTGAGDRSESTSRSGPMGRIAHESRALFDDLREWVDLRVQLIQVDVEERIEKAANEIMSMVLVMVMALFTMVFLLHGLAIWLGTLLGGAQWGYLIIGAFLGFLTWMIRRVRPNHFRRMASMYRVEAPAEEETTLSLKEAESAAPDTGEETGENERG